MGDIVRFRKPTLKDKHKGKTLCRSGFHKWEVDNSVPFNVKQGKLLTHYRCTRCGKKKSTRE